MSRKSGDIFAETIGILFVCSSIAFFSYTALCILAAFGAYAFGDEDAAFPSALMHNWPKALWLFASLNLGINVIVGIVAEAITSIAKKMGRKNGKDSD